MSSVQNAIMMVNFIEYDYIYRYLILEEIQADLPVNIILIII